MLDNHEKSGAVSFEKARCQYCKELFERERARKESLEKKSQAILSLVTLILGVIFFRLDFFADLKNILDTVKISVFVAAFLYGTLFALGLCLSCALFSVLRSIKVQIYKEEHPKNFISSLFAPGSNYLQNENEASLYRAIAMSYAIALEQNSDVNDKKAIWIRYSWYFLIASVALLASFIAMYAYMVSM